MKARDCCTLAADVLDHRRRPAAASGAVLAPRSSSSASAQPSITLSGLFRSWATVPAKATRESWWACSAGDVADHDHRAARIAVLHLERVGADLR